MPAPTFSMDCPFTIRVDLKVPVVISVTFEAMVIEVSANKSTVCAFAWKVASKKIIVPMQTERKRIILVLIFAVHFYFCLIGNFFSNIQSFDTIVFDLNTKFSYNGWLAFFYLNGACSTYILRRSMYG